MSGQVHGSSLSVFWELLDHNNLSRTIVLGLILGVVEIKKIHGVLINLPCYYYL